jgi:hypothetical protein
MKYSLLKSALVAIAGLALCAPVVVHADDAAATTTTTASSSSTTTTTAKKIHYGGMVKSVDTAANTITVTTKKGDMTFAVNPMTKITANKQSATLTDITMGEKVGGTYTQDAAGTMTACSIWGHPVK